LQALAIKTEITVRSIYVDEIAYFQETHSSSFLWTFGPSSSNPTSYQYEETVDEPAVYDPNNQIG
jgi:E3 ubiquitin-protein ligase RNF115/126